MKEDWYKKGINFGCSGCGGCCKGYSGFVWLTKTDIENLSSLLKIDKENFLKNYTIKVGDFRSLKELKFENYRCIFLKDNKCIVYDARPFQCRSFPFWPQHLISEDVWKESISSYCGIYATNERFFSYEMIKNLVDEFNSYKGLYYPK